MASLFNISAQTENENRIIWKIVIAIKFVGLILSLYCLFGGLGQIKDSDDRLFYFWILIDSIIIVTNGPMFFIQLKAKQGQSNEMYLFTVYLLQQDLHKQVDILSKIEEKTIRENLN